ncbi:hypothetical protein EAF04_007141 [Stromatinia cepivora]|nr:hypothetical protein EAF04_007141 [Stromatinia cepivora]
MLSMGFPWGYSKSMVYEGCSIGLERDDESSVCFFEKNGENAWVLHPSIWSTTGRSGPAQYPRRCTSSSGGKTRSQWSTCPSNLSHGLFTRASVMLQIFTLSSHHTVTVVDNLMTANPLNMESARPTYPSKGCGRSHISPQPTTSKAPYQNSQNFKAVPPLCMYKEDVVCILRSNTNIKFETEMPRQGYCLETLSSIEFDRRMGQRKEHNDRNTKGSSQTKEGKGPAQVSDKRPPPPPGGR